MTTSRLSIQIETPLSISDAGRLCFSAVKKVQEDVMNTHNEIVKPHIMKQ